MVNSFFYSNTSVETALSGSVSPGATSMEVDATTGFPDSFPYVLAVDFEASAEELVKVTAADGATLTIEKGFGGTSDQSHSIGAVVLHVVNAQDLTDFRTHEASTGAVHGLTGDIVGTSETQTLANKTLTSPTINSGTLSGNFTGTPTFDDGIIIGASTVDESAGGAVEADTNWQSRGSAASDTAYSALVDGDGFDRLRILADGQMDWGPGDGSRDVRIYREEADTLASDDTFRVYRSATSLDALSIRVDGDTASRLFIEADGAMFWGTGSTTTDTNLYRDSNDVLKTDDTFLAANIRAGSDQVPAPGASPGQTTVTVTFTTAMAGTPRVTATARSSSSDLDNSNIRWAVDNVSTTGFDINCWRDTDFGTVFDWIAISDTE